MPPRTSGRSAWAAPAVSAAPTSDSDMILRILRRSFLVMVCSFLS
jgi:hypothetical protein